MNERLNDILKAIEAERAFEEQYYREILAQKTIQEKVASGAAWYPVSLVRSYYTVGEHVEAEIEATYEVVNHKLKVGAGVSFFTNNHNEMVSYSGTISFVRKNKMKIIFHQDVVEKLDERDGGHMGVELIYDERPYTIMKEAMEAVRSAKNNAISELKVGIEKLDSFDYAIKDYKCNAIPHLNASQNQAIEGCLKAHRMAIIHGPPGTGKTTTIVGLVGEILKNEKQVLVCAPSNNAVDLLAYKLHMAGYKVLRLGNITRIDDDILHLSMDEQLRNTDDWSQIKKCHIEAEEIRKKALKYKRSFGPEERRLRYQLLREVRELRAWGKDMERRLVDKVIHGAEVILTTLIGASSIDIEGLKFKTVIIDEASQALEPECWNVILKGEKVVLVGDHKQLPPTVKSKEALAMHFDHTLLDRMIPVLTHTYLLDTQYRMNDKILAFSNEAYYQGRLKSAPHVADWTLKGSSEVVVFVDTAGAGFEEMRRDGQISPHNEGEWHMIREYILQSKERLLGHSIGIISPYAEQVRHIRNEYSEDKDINDLDIDVDSIDGFQGQERDVIFLSLVRSNDNGEIGFLADERRLNVALTRAKKHLVIVGDSATLGQHPTYGKLIDYIEKNNGYKSAWEYMM